MVAGALRTAGYFMGERLKGPRASNPRGFFESFEINDINEDLLAGVVRNPRGFVARRLFGPPLRRDQRWLARLPVGAPVPCSGEITERIRAATGRAPYCFKDPRFCYTLPAWRPYLDNVLYVCVFRSPGRTAQSILKNCRTDGYLRGIRMTPRLALRVWLLMYQNILRIHCREGDWLFLHYDQVLGGDGLKVLAGRLGASVDFSFPDPSLNRAPEAGRLPTGIRRAYAHLCELAGYRPPGGM